MKKKTKNLLESTALIAASAVVIGGVSGITVNAAENDADSTGIPATIIDDESGNTFYATDDINDAKTGMDAAHELSDAAEEVRENAETNLNDAIAEKDALVQEKEQKIQDAEAAKAEVESQIEGNKANAATAVENADNDVAEKQAELEEATTATETATTELAEATQAVESAKEDMDNKQSAAEAQDLEGAQAAVENDQTDIANAISTSETAKTESETAETEYNNAKELSDAAETAMNNAQSDVDEKTTALETTKADEKTKTDRYDDLNGYNTGVKDPKTSTEYTNLESASQEVENANSNLSEAQSNKENAEQAVTDAQSALTNAEDEKTTAQSEAESAQSAVDDAEQAYADAMNNTAVKEAEMNQATSDYQSASQTLSDAQQAAGDAVKAEDDAGLNVAYKQVDLVEAQEAEQAAKAELEAAADKYNQGAWAFYQYLIDDPDVSDDVKTSAKWALDILNQHDADNLRQVGSATQVENIKTAIKMMKKGNELRVADKNYPGLEPLKVSLRLMAIGQYHADKSLNDHLRDMNTGENLAWGYNNPYEGWYWMELYKYNKGDRTHAVGHYTNLVGHSCEGVNLEYTVTGYGMTSPSRALGGARTDAQEFQSDPTNERGAMTVDEFEALFNKFLESIDIESLTTVYNDAVTAVTDAQSALDTAEQELATASDTKSSCETAVTNAQSDVDAKFQALTDVTNEYNALLATESSVYGQLLEKQEILTEKNNVLSGKIDDYDNAGRLKTAADDNLTSATTDLTNAETRVSTANSTKEAAQAAYDALFDNAALSQAKSDMESAIASRETAETDLSTAQGVLEAATTDYNTKKAETDRLETVKSEKNDAYLTAQQAVTDANEKLESDQTTLDEINGLITAYEDAKVVYEDAVAVEDAKRAALATALEDGEQKSQALEEANGVLSAAEQALEVANAITFENLTADSDIASTVITAKTRYNELADTITSLEQEIETKTGLIEDLQSAYDEAHQNALTAFADYLLAKTNYESMLPTYTVIKGDNADWTKGDNADLEVAVDGLFDQFNDVYVDGVRVDPSKYATFAGSTHVVFHKDYLNALSTGLHEVLVNFDFGTATSHFTIGEKVIATADAVVNTATPVKSNVAVQESEVKTVDANVPEAQTSNKTAETVNTKSPQTGDVPVLPFAATSIAGIAGALFAARKKKEFQNCNNKLHTFAPHHTCGVMS